MTYNNNFQFKILTKKLIEFKEKNNLSYQTIADALGVNKSHIQRVATMETLPSLKFLVHLASFMKIPLFALFVPTNELIQQEYASLINKQLESLEWDLTELAKKTKIPYLRLQDIIQSNVSPSNEENTLLTTVLHIDDMFNSYEIKENLLIELLRGMDLNENQIQNIIEYTKNKKI